MKEGAKVAAEVADKYSGEEPVAGTEKKAKETR